MKCKLEICVTPLSGEIRHEVVALVHTDSTGRVLEDELVWARDLLHR